MFINNMQSTLIVSHGETQARSPKPNLYHGVSFVKFACNSNVIKLLDWFELQLSPNISTAFTLQLECLEHSPASEKVTLPTDNLLKYRYQRPAATIRISYFPVALAFILVRGFWRSGREI